MASIAHEIRVLTVMLAVVVVAVMLCALTAFAASRKTASFDEPLGVAVSAGRVWVTNVAGNSVTELNAANGSVLRVFNASKYGFKTPIAVSVAGSHVWVVNEGVAGDKRGTGSLTELNAKTGALIQVISVDAAHFDNPAGIAVSNSQVWVTNLQTANGDGSVTSLNAQSGAVLRVVKEPGDEFDGPIGVAAQGAEVWVASSGTKNYEGDGQDTGSVTELNATTDAVVRVIEAGSVDFDEPTAIALSAGHVWITNLYYDSIVELNSSNGSLTRVIKSNSLNQPLALAVSGGHVWVADFQSNAVTELNTSNGSVRRVLTSGFDEPADLASAGQRVWVTNDANSSVTEINASNGVVVRVIR
jgi:outer membrane protein assembly factor BamB